MRHVALLRTARAASRLSIALVADFRFENDIQIPQPAIFIAPHRSMFDVPLGIETFHRLRVAPLLVVSESQLRALRVPESNWDALDLLPIARNTDGRSSLLDAGTEALAARRSVAIMPEGRVNRTGGEKLRSGAADLATATQAPVVVIGSAGSEQFWQRGRPATFANPIRKPAVVIAHEVVQPGPDIPTTFERIATSLAAAESAARDRFASIRER